MAPRSRTAGYDTAKIRRWAARPGEWSPPELLQLVRVLPIAQSVAHDGVELTALSLEAYTDGFLVNLRLLTAAAQPRTPESHAFPDLDLHATDDRGGRYEVWPDGGSGSGRQWRYTHLFTPALDPAARELRLEAPEVRWLCMGPEGLDKAETQPGPWRFVVTLPVEGHRGP